MFNETRTAQMAAYLLTKGGGRMRYIKLTKLLYLADRESMRQTGDSMTRDRFFSMKNGPILSQTLNLLRNESHSDRWSAVVCKDGFETTLVDGVDARDLGELSPFDIDILDQVHVRFGPMGWRDLCEWTHNNCAEWSNPGRSHAEIAPRQIFEALGCPTDQAQRLDARYAERDELDRLWASYN